MLLIPLLQSTPLVPRTYLASITEHCCLGAPLTIRRDTLATSSWTSAEYKHTRSESTVIHVFDRHHLLHSHRLRECLFSPSEFALPLDLAYFDLLCSSDWLKGLRLT